MTLTIKQNGKPEERIEVCSFGFGWYHLKHKKHDRFCACWTCHETGDFHIAEAKDIEEWSIEE